MASSKLSEFFKSRLNPITNNNSVENISEKPLESNMKNVIYNTKDYDSLGYEQSGKHSGKLSAFIGLIKLIENVYRKKVYDDEDEQQKNKIQEQAVLVKLEAEKENNEHTIKQLEKSVDDNLKKIEEKNKEIVSIKQDPKSILDEKPSKLGFIVGSIVLTFLTIYLFLFYVSTSYSAFFKVFNVHNATVSASIFDPNAFANAYNSGNVFEAIMITVAPFIFLSLGILIDVFTSKRNDPKKYLKAGALILVTLVLDIIMAYKIDKNIHDIMILNQVGVSSQLYGFGDAIFSINFWLVIFSGFVVYIIWGILYSFVLESHEKMDVVKQEIKKRRIDIEGLEKINEVLAKKIADINIDILECNKKIKESKNFIDGNTIRMNWNRLYSSLREFANGWARYIQGLHPDNSENMVNEILLNVDNYITNHSKQIKDENQ